MYNKQQINVIRKKEQNSSYERLGALVAENTDLKIRLEKSKEEVKQLDEKLQTAIQELEDARNYIRKWGGE
tara:strand:+ start:6663 stop:6875 length:213 start_codon:yes stop_codon:yes gene_type:complete